MTIPTKSTSPVSSPRAEIAPLPLRTASFRAMCRRWGFGVLVAVLALGGVTSVRQYLHAAARPSGRVLGSALHVPTDVPRAQKQPMTISELADDFRRQQRAGLLAIGAVTLQSTPSDWGAVLLLPQLHRHPGSANADAVNDRAVRAQQQSYDILRELVQQRTVDVVMVEGELAGPVATEKRERAARRLAARDEMVRVQRAIHGAIAEAAPETRSRLEALARTIPAAITRANRDLLLDGAPYQLWAEGQLPTLWGSENSETRAASADLVRKQLYLQDRLAALTASSPSGIPSQSARVAPQRSAVLAALRARHPSGKAKMPSAASIANFSAADPVLAPFVTPLASAFATLRETEASLPSSATGMTGNAPSRAANPYARIQDPAMIRQLMEANETAIATTVLERRNAETVEYLVRALRERSGTISVLQFGAAHAEGLTQLLRAQGLGVLTVTPKEVGQRMRE
ncbi:hypothetical protein HY632_01925 [Candidatus Uhrbacteria bacterium]|nr:hypothetical protein [Candidatus Uhrbacteria bacterium]